ncbi:hypothetical protein E2I00_015350 [Balaenoptera physalus]|uniref:Uncharacterized protein n=1 Tax=Balaenoptera physalus TaxID=9770 RepID=A0A643CA36_BALPH|nr:hypothetical protein E2I00_015350 [Balaenoptera physalus]
MEADFWGLRSNVPFVGGCFGSFVEKLLYKKIKIVMKLSYSKGFILLMHNILLFHKPVSDEHLLNKVFSQHSLQDPPQISGKDLAAVLAKKSGLATNVTVTSFLMNLLQIQKRNELAFPIITGLDSLTVKNVMPGCGRIILLSPKIYFYPFTILI